MYYIHLLIIETPNALFISILRGWLITLDMFVFDRLIIEIIKLLDAMHTPIVEKHGITS